MPKQITQNRIVNSGPATNAAAQITDSGAATAAPATTQRTGNVIRRIDPALEVEAQESVLPRSALATALAPFYDGQVAEENATVVEPPPEAVVPETNETAATAAEENATGANETEETAGTVENAETAEGAEQAETAETTEDPTGAAGETPGVQKRIEGLLRKVGQLEQRLAQATSGSGAVNHGPLPLAEVTDEGELDRRANEAEEALDEADQLLTQLAVAPGQVERYLRRSGVKLVDGLGEEDYTPERMAAVLVQARRVQKQMLKAVPQRRQWLAQHAQAHAQAVAEIPWLSNPEDDRHTMMQTIERQFPALKSQPNYEYWLAAAIEGHQAIEARRATGVAATGGRPRVAGRTTVPNTTNTNGNGQVRRSVPTLPNTGSRGASAARMATNGKVAAAAQAVKKEGSRGALSKFLDVSGFTR